jgi:hypothetical protein
MDTFIPLIQALIVGGFALAGIVVTQSWTTRRDYTKHETADRARGRGARPVLRGRGGDSIYSVVSRFFCTNYIQAIT